MNMLTFEYYEDAKKYADKTNQPLWDTHALPWRYVVGHLDVETEEDPDNEDWEQVS